MFDLFRSRDKAVRLVLGGLLLLVALSMLTYLVPNYETATTGNFVVASVGGQDIHADEVDHIIQSAMRGRQLPPDMLPIYVPQMIDDIISQRAMEYEARRLGFQVTDAQLRTTIQQMVPSLFPDGRFVGKDQYAAMLAQQGNLTIDQFENDVRRQILITRLQDVAVEGSIVTPLEIENAYKQKYERIKIEYVKIPSDKYKAELTPSDADMRSYYEHNIANYQSPEKKNLVLLIADQAKIEQSITIPDDELRKIYNQNQAQYHVPEQATVRHILFMTQGKPPADDAKIKAQAEQVMNEIKSGKLKFEDAVKKYSEDPGSKDKGGEYTIQHGQMVKEFEDASFTQKPGDITLVKTSYGYHIVQVEKREPAHQQTFDEVKNQIAEQAKKSKVNDILQRASDQAQTMLTKDPTHPEKVAADLDMQMVKVDGLEPGKPIPEVGPSPDFDQAVSALKVGQVTPPVALANNKMVVAELTGITPPKPQPFDEVKDKVKDAMLAFRLPAKVRDVANQLIAKAKANGDLAAAAKEMGFKMETTDPFLRTDTVPGFGSANYITQAFSSPNGAVLGPILMPDSTVVVKVVEHVPADMSKLPAERATIRDQIKSQKASDRDTLFKAGLVQRLTAEGKIKKNQEAVNKIIANFRQTS